MGVGADKNEKQSLFTTIIVIFCWYASNIVLLLLNKFLLSSTSFRQPVFLTLCHMAACVIMGGLIAATGQIPVKPLKSRVQLAKVAVLSVIFCGTIVLGNASLKFIPVSFNQAIGATTPFFTAMFAFFCQGSRESFITYLTLLPVVGGVMIASGGEPLFHGVGFMFCLMATAGRALKSVVQSILMTDPSEKLDPMSLLLYMSAICVAILIPATVILEPNAYEVAARLTAAKSGFLWWLILNSSLAYAVNLTNFLVTKYTSPLTLQVLGNAKGVVAAFVSVLVFLNPVTVTGALGYAVTVSGVFLYSETKRRSKAAAASAGAAAGGAAIMSSPGLNKVSNAGGIQTSPHRNKEAVNGDHKPFRYASPENGDYRV
mmetsp:Transcript_13757/g.29598  ORF Transcript_13757/g.29598 Transcript_13757/m.29598 type:complete len:373 (+) Transcript_13757:157-1275(+)|eukprot:CAMPEP_0202911438 /NCGR_PEP_ID=MMETSP1392-20130828/54970_1 /ASSEMBLY_ACC=CAM_ASM_000868 /TAXON_ID=225041 /ORGANISM="Chlamydomonas chlamydogama, Strain SAG 11-48b" /LENGTH=372 /DNA_ID=CAMNT_0049601933 /DNA_START=106 /DNA_END=1224 /DNA_ORIENTATION=+